MNEIFFHGICVNALSDRLDAAHDSCWDVICDLDERDLVYKYHSCFQLSNLLKAIMTLCNLSNEIIDHYNSKEDLDV